jgi:deoxyribodipyrimidine photo-lyase
MIQPARISVLKDAPARKGEFILYWMQQSQRAECNHALEHAIDQANEYRLPLLVYFGCTAGFPEAHVRHYQFMLEGIFETAHDLAQRGIQLAVRLEDPAWGVCRLAARAALVVTDMGYLHVQRRWRNHAAENLECPLIQVESDAVVPVRAVSGKEEYAAATLRPKLRKILPNYLAALGPRELKRDSLGIRVESWKGSVAAALSALGVGVGAAPVSCFTGGARHARERLDAFLDQGLPHYARDRSDPSLGCVSRLSPFLHFGQISPLLVALEASRHAAAGTDAFLEELIVRRELALNFTFYNQHYDDFSCLPEWAVETLKKHRNDRRYSIYTREELEAAHTHDPYWNAAQRELRESGHMHGYMRMYWGKKILEWGSDPREAYRTALALNNKWGLDGRDPGGFAGVAWCFGKHDRPWPERPIFGKVRFMNEKGLERKFDMETYVKSWLDKK